MHDFCFTIPYGLVLVIGGVIRYLKKRSTTSLGGGVGTGLSLIFAGYLSLKAFEKRKNSFLGLAIETVIIIMQKVFAKRVDHWEGKEMAPVELLIGFRFHPTDEVLVNYYLKRKINGQEIELYIIPEVDLYKCEPWELAKKSFLPSRDSKRYFFRPQDRKHLNGFRTNIATRAGYWKSIEKDRRVNSQNRVIRMKKTVG